MKNVTTCFRKRCYSQHFLMLRKFSQIFSRLSNISPHKFIDTTNKRTNKTAQFKKKQTVHRSLQHTKSQRQQISQKLNLFLIETGCFSFIETVPSQKLQFKKVKAFNSPFLLSKLVACNSCIWDNARHSIFMQLSF